FNSQTLISSDGDRRPAFFNASVKLLLCRLLLAPENSNVPLNVLPPSRGTTLRTTPAVSASPRPPDVLITISCDPATFTTAAFEFAPAHPMLRPSESVRESDGRPPCRLEAPPPVPALMPPLSPVVAAPGMIAIRPV